MSFNAFLEPVSLPISQALGLPRLPSHFGTVLLSFSAYHLIQWSCPFVLSKLFPEYYGKASRRVKLGWATRICSMINTLLLVPLAFRCLNLPELENDKVRGTHPLEGYLEALACGFLWDAIDESLVHFHDVGFAFHGILVLFALLLTFRPLFAYVSVRFILMESSTLFLNIHWFLKQTGRADTTLNVINGVFLLVVFFLARICYGGLTAYRFIITLYEARNDIPRSLLLIYATGTLGLQYLNWAWLCKILYMFKKTLSAGGKNTKKL